MNTCTKCKSEKVDKGFLDGYGGNSYKSNRFGVWNKNFSHIKNTVFVCLDCGYSEMFMDVDMLNKKLNNNEKQPD